MCCRCPSGWARIDRNSTGRPVNTRLQPIRRVLIARLRVLRRRLPNIWRPETRSRQPGADCTGHTGQTFRRPSGTRQRAALWRWIVYRLSGSHVSRRVVSASASSSPSCVRTLPIGDRVAKPLPLSLAEFLVVPLGSAVVVLCPAWVPVATGTFCLLRSAGGCARPEVQLTRKGC
jgi:hypothetical protein